MRIIAKLMLAAVGALALVLVGTYAYLSSLDVGEYRDDIARIVKDSTGRDLIIAGNISLDVFPAPRLVVEKVSLSNAEWGKRPHLMSVERLEAQIALLPLISRTVSIERVALVRPSLLLERNAAGDSNWLLWSKGPATSTGTPLVVDVSNVELRNGRVSYQRHGDLRPMVLEIHELRLRSRGWLKPLAVHFEGRFNQMPIKAVGETGSLATFLKNEPFSVDLKLSSRGGVAGVKGGLKRPMELRGVGARLEVNLKDLGKLMPASADRRLAPIQVNGNARVRDDKGRYVLDQLELTVGPGDLYGSISVGKRSGRRLLTAVLGSKRLDIDAFFENDRSGGPAPSNRRVIPAWRLPAAMLRALEAEVHYSGQAVVFRGMEFKRLTTDMTLASGRLTLNPRAELYGGIVDGRLELDGTSAPSRLQAELRGTRVNVGALVNAVKGNRIMSGGRGEFLVKLEGEGDTPRDIAASLDGRVLTNIGPARINNSIIESVGTDVAMKLVRSINPGVNRDAQTRMHCAVIRFDVVDGVAKTSRGIAAETKRMNVIGSGEVNLGSERIDLAVRTEPRDGVGLSAASLGSMVRVGGTLADPAPQVDALGALKTGASVGAAVATSGISLLVQGLFKRVTADHAPCESALGIKDTAAPAAARASSRAASESGGRPPAGGSGNSGSKGLGDALKSLGRSLSNLFGN